MLFFIPVLYYTIGIMQISWINCIPELLNNVSNFSSRSQVSRVFLWKYEIWLYERINEPYLQIMFHDYLTYDFIDLFLAVAKNSSKTHENQICVIWSQIYCSDNHKKANFTILNGKLVLLSWDHRKNPWIICIHKSFLTISNFSSSGHCFQESFYGITKSVIRVLPPNHKSLSNIMFHDYLIYEFIDLFCQESANIDQIPTRLKLA
jgi:hypothetical protein